jgi:CBS domain-containing protein
VNDTTAEAGGNSQPDSALQLGDIRQHLRCWELLLFERRNGRRSQMLARDIMTRDPIWVLPSDPIWRAAEMMRYHGIGCTPVIADEASRKVVGLLTDRDITTRCVARKHSGACRVADHMTSTPIHVVLTTEDASRVMRKMEAARVRRVPVSRLTVR